MVGMFRFCRQSVDTPTPATFRTPQKIMITLRSMRACAGTSIATRLFKFTAALIGAATIAQAAPSSLNINYQNWTNGAVYTQSMATTDWKELKYWDSNATLSIKQYDAANGYRGLRVKLAKDKVEANSGMIYVTKLADGTDYT
jgi:hypothetical protein